MPQLIPAPTRVEAAGNKPIVIDEYVGLVNSHEGRVSVARIQCPAGWIEPPQTPEFDEYTVVLRGRLRVHSADGEFDVRAGQGILTRRGERVQYSTPGDEGADYIAVCLPAYSFEQAHREA
jgi:mannose-6-phosphate isomerase-like protein (cupin superfamily)